MSADVSAENRLMTRVARESRRRAGSIPTRRFLRVAVSGPIIGMYGVFALTDTSADQLAFAVSRRSATDGLPAVFES